MREYFGDRVPGIDGITCVEVFTHMMGEPGARDSLGNMQVQATLRQEVEASQAVHADLDDSYAHGARPEEQLIERVNASAEIADILAFGRGLQPVSHSVAHILRRA